MIQSVLAGLVAVAMPMQAAALSCLAPSLQRSFTEANAGPETYIVVSGRVTLDAAKLPRSGGTAKPPAEMTKVPARLIGKSMSKSGFTRPFDKPITLEVACYGPWCGAISSGQDVLAFVKRDTGSYAIDINPCGGRAFPNPTARNLEEVLGCFRGAACSVP